MTTTINGRTPEEIKKGLECTITESLGLCEGNIFCENCECYAENAAIGIQAIADGLILINQLLADNKRLKCERNAAVEVLKQFECNSCIHENVGVEDEPCVNCIHNYAFRLKGSLVDNWRWRWHTGGR